MSIMDAMIDDTTGGALTMPFDYSVPAPNSRRLSEYCRKSGKAISELSDTEIEMLSSPARKQRIA